MKCVLCEKEAEYVQSGMSLCEKHFKAHQTASDRDIDLMKIQIYADRCHTFFTVGCTLAFVVLGFWGVFATVYYQGWSSLKISDVYVGWIGMTTMLIVTVVALGIFRIRYDRACSRISKMLEKVKKGELLATLDELGNDC